MSCRKTVCVIIPVYKSQITENEKISIQNTMRKLNGLDIFFVTYFGEHIKFYQQFSGAQFKLFDKMYFENINGYNKLMLSCKFYRAFFQYKYMLLVQPDAFIFKGKDELMKILSDKYDYWGAPWVGGLESYRFLWDKHGKWLNRYPMIKWLVLGKKEAYFVGNGGLSLRKIKKTWFLLLQKFLYVKTWEGNEDLFFAVHGSHNLCGFKIASAEKAVQFALEVNMRKKMAAGEIPFGVHAWERYYPNMLEEHRYR